VKCHCHYVFLLRFVVHNCYLIFAMLPLLAYILKRGWSSTLDNLKLNIDINVF